MVWGRLGRLELAGIVGEVGAEGGIAGGLRVMDLTARPCS